MKQKFVYFKENESIEGLKCEIISAPCNFEIDFCTLLLKNNFNPKTVSKLMGHAKELITMDVYGDKREIIADCVNELQPFIDEVLPNQKEDEVSASECIEVVISVEDYLI